MIDSARGSPPAGLVSGQGSSAPQPAPLLRRFAALLYESLLLGALLLLAGFALAAIVSPSPDPGLRSPQIPSLPARILTLAALFVVAGAYYVWSWTGGRRSLPMKTWRLRLVRIDGRSLDARTALTRYVAAWIGPVLMILAYAALQPTGHARFAFWLLGVNYAWALIDRDRRFLHDRIARTRLIDDRAPRRDAPPGARRAG